MFTWSENPSKDMWEHIKFLGNKMNCKNLLTGQLKSSRTIYPLSPDDLERKSSQISMCINQAVEFFESAEEVTIRTSPVLMFYGMLSLTKALIVANEPTVYVEDISYHGLHTRPRYPELRTYKANKDLWTIEKEFSLTSGGVFKLLTQILDDFTFPDESYILFKDILSVVPEISNLFVKYYSEFPSSLEVYSFGDNPNLDINTLSTTLEDLTEIYTRLPELHIHYELQPQKYHGIAHEFKLKENAPDDIIVPYNGMIGGRHAVTGLKYFDGNGFVRKHLSTASLDYIALHTLSVVARYKQDFWGSILSSEKSGVIGLISLYLNVVKRRFPNIILNELYNEEFEYGTPSRIS